MGWISLPIAFLFILVASFGSFFLSSAWERRRKRNEAIDKLRAALPGYDCGLCGFDDCRRYARDLVEKNGDPALCSPGAEPCESRLRGLLGGERAKAKVAFVRCGGSVSAAKALYHYDGRENCAASAALFGGSKSCPHACLGLGSCALACSLNAISMKEGLAVVDPERCSGCGACVPVCPHNVICLVPATAPWQVACNSRRNPEDKKEDCSAACISCGKCGALSASWEFSLVDGLAVASASVPETGSGSGAFSSIAAHCPTGAIVRMGSKRPMAPEKPAIEVKVPQTVSAEAPKPVETPKSAPENSPPGATGPQ
jgi:Na+-translocating ferredoxin:NAD+ oxidoreductase RNF subunit RnfB